MTKTWRPFNPSKLANFNNSVNASTWLNDKKDKKQVKKKTGRMKPRKEIINEKKIKQVKKRGFCQPVAKYEDENQANISTRTSTKSSSVLKKKKEGEKQQNLTFWSEVNKTDLLLVPSMNIIQSYCSWVLEILTGYQYHSTIYLTKNDYFLTVVIAKTSINKFFYFLSRKYDYETI